MLRKISSLFLMALIFNLNMVVPAVSYAVADETCACHLNSADHQCHSEDGCKSCGMHKKEGSENHQKVGWAVPTTIKGRTCSTSPQGDGSILPVSAIPFMVPVFCNAVPMVQVSNLSLQSENLLHGIFIAPVEKPPAS